MERSSKDNYFLRITKEVAEQSTCLKHKVGCVLVRDNRILTTGYNGQVSGFEHCLDIGCIREGIASGEQIELCRAIHAEQNAIIQAAIHGISIKEAVCYCTHQPCITCLKMLLNAGIFEFHYIYKYDDNLYRILGKDIEYIEIRQHDI